MVDFVNNLLTNELTLPNGVNFEIQKAHRALLAKPYSNSSSRSVIVNFLRFEIKEMVLTGWCMEKEGVLVKS